MNNYPKVSIIILNFNGTEDTLECLDSVFNTSYPVYEVILVDNASAAGSLEPIRRRPFKLTIIENKKNLGFAEGNNVGIKKAMLNGSDFVMLLNNDAIIAPDTVSCLVNTASQDNNIGALSPLILYYNTLDKVWSPGGMMNYWKGDWLKAKPKENNPSFYDVEALSGCCLMLSSQAIDECGLFDGSFFLYAEDIDLCLRLGKAGYRLVCAPQAKAWHKVGRSIRALEPSLYLYYITRNRLLLMKKYGSFINWIFFFPYFVYTVILQRSFYYVLSAKFESLKGLYWGIRDFLAGNFGPGRR